MDAVNERRTASLVDTDASGDRDYRMSARRLGKFGTASCGSAARAGRASGASPLAREDQMDDDMEDSIDRDYANAATYVDFSSCNSLFMLLTLFNLIVTHNCSESDSEPQ